MLVINSILQVILLLNMTPENRYLKLISDFDILAPDPGWEFSGITSANNSLANVIFGTRFDSNSSFLFPYFQRTPDTRCLNGLSCLELNLFRPHFVAPGLEGVSKLGMTALTILGLPFYHFRIAMDQGWGAVADGNCSMFHCRTFGLGICASTVEREGTLWLAIGKYGLAILAYEFQVMRFFIHALALRYSLTLHVTLQTLRSRPTDFLMRELSRTIKRMNT